MEPGQWKVSVGGYDSNNAPMNFKLRITKPFRWDPPGEPWVSKKIKTGDVYLFDYYADGLSRLTFDLSWNRDWSRFPTNDIDMVIYGPHGISVGGATCSAPEKVIIDSPPDGLYTIEVSGYEVYGKDRFKLYVTPE